MAEKDGDCGCNEKALEIPPDDRPDFAAAEREKMKALYPRHEQFHDIEQARENG